MSDLKDLARIQMQNKNMGLGLLLTIIFGGIGLLYINIIWGIIGAIIEFVVVLLTFLTFGIGLLILIPWHIFAIVVMVVGVNKHNEKLLASLK